MDTRIPLPDNSPFPDIEWAVEGFVPDVYKHLPTLMGTYGVMSVSEGTKGQRLVWGLTRHEAERIAAALNACRGIPTTKLAAIRLYTKDQVAKGDHANAGT